MRVNLHTCVVCWRETEHIAMVASKYENLCPACTKAIIEEKICLVGMPNLEVIAIMDRSEKKLLRRAKLEVVR